MCSGDGTRGDCSSHEHMLGGFGCPSTTDPPGCTKISRPHMEAEPQPLRACPSPQPPCILSAAPARILVSSPGCSAFRNHKVPLLPASHGPYVSFSTSQLSPCSHCSPPLLPLSFLPHTSPSNAPHCLFIRVTVQFVCAPSHRVYSPMGPQPTPTQAERWKVQGSSLLPLTTM